MPEPQHSTIPPSPLAAEQRVQGDADSLRHALRLGAGVAAGTGAAMTGYQLLRWLTAGAPPENPIKYSPAEVELRIPVRKKRPFLLPEHPYYSKTAKAPAVPAPTPATPPPPEDWATYLARAYNSLGKSAPSGLSTIGQGASNVLGGSQPWRNIGLTLGTAGVGLLGGYHGSRWLIKQLKKKERTSDLSDAQREYEEALFSQYDRSRLKRASAEPSALDRLYEQYAQAPVPQGQEKKALFDWYMPYAMGAGGVSALVAYLNHRKDTQELLEGALKRRAAERAMRQPPEMSLRTTPVPVAEEVDEDDEDYKPPRRRSSWGF